MDGSVETLWIWFLSVDTRKFRANLLHFPCTLLKLLLRYVTFIRIVGDLEFGMGWNGLCTKKLAVHLTPFSRSSDVVSYVSSSADWR
jgi:hypothetical protein